MSLVYALPEAKRFGNKISSEVKICFYESEKRSFSSPRAMAKRSEKKKARSGEIFVQVADAGAVGQRLPSWLSRDWLWGLSLVLAVILTYQPVWHAGFIWDDDDHVTANPCIVGPLGLREIWTTKAAQICPLVLTTFWVEHALWGLWALPYHLVNVLMQGMCAVVLWRVLLSLKIPGAWLGAALWVLHPVQVESVAWITEMKNTQSGLFFLLSILFFVRWLRPVENQKRNGWNYALTLVFAALAMASKSSTVILPAALCLCAWWVEGRWRWSNLARVVPAIFMSIAAGVLSVWTQTLQAGEDLRLGDVPTWPERMVMTGDAVWFYLGKLVWPHPLITIYPRWQIDAGQWISYLPLLAVIVILFILWLKRETWLRPWFFAFAYFLVALLPVLGLVDRYVADHYQYLPSMGPLALAAAGMVALANFVIPGRFWLRTSLCAGVLLILGLVSWQRAWAYESEETLWTDTLAKNPECWVGHNNLGLAVSKKGQLDEAITRYQKALEINSNYVQAHNNLGLALVQKGQMDGAIIQYQKALEIRPNYADAHYNLGIVLMQKGQVDEAMAQFQKALEINPIYAKAHNNLGAAFLQKGREEEAMAQWQKTLEIDPNNSEAHGNLGAVLLQKGQVDQAVDQFQKAVEIKPNDAEAHSNLGFALLQKGRVDEAIVEYEKALEINPGDAKAHGNLGVALVQKGQVDDGIAEYEKALEINPGDAKAHSNIGAALAEKGRMDEAIAQFQEAVRLDPNNSSAQNNLARAQASKNAGKVPSHVSK